MHARVRGRLDAIPVLAILLIPNPAVAGWSLDGNPLCRARTAQAALVLAPDGAGGVFVAWEDARSGILSVYAQHLTSSGAIVTGWPADGLKICSANSTQQAPAIASDGSGGAFIAWQDDRAGSGIQLTRITAG